ncbi:MAG: MBL fold metallo-hydrolase [Burkholderiaceae bacterium]
MQNVKHFLRALLAAVLFFPAVAAVQAQTPMVKTNTPGFYRMMLGDFEITALSDGTASLEFGKLLKNVTPKKLSELLAREFLNDPVETSVNAYLINTGSKLVLVDAGAAALFGPTLGKLSANLMLAGYRVEQVDMVILTHMHPDHVGGLIINGQRAFPNATVIADQSEADYWLNPNEMARAPNDMVKSFFQGAMASVNPYVQAGKFQGVSSGTEVTPGIRLNASHGHTAGHATIEVQSAGQKLMMWGDLIHLGAVQFAHPEVTIAFDNDSVHAASQRKKAFVDASKKGYLVAASHLSFPGIGRVQTQGKGYRWVPLNYSQVR